MRARFARNLFICVDIRRQRPHPMDGWGLLHEAEQPADDRRTDVAMTQWDS